jgi:hypothetical protein
MGHGRVLMAGSKNALQWEIPTGTGPGMSGYVLEYTVTLLSELTEEKARKEAQDEMSFLPT